MKLMSKKNNKNESGAKNTPASPVAEQQDSKSVHAPGAAKNRR